MYEHGREQYEPCASHKRREEVKVIIARKETALA